MIKEVKLPEVSDNVETGDVLKVLVAVGDTINVDQPVIELETDKASFEVPSSESGVVKEINVKQGDIIRIGAVILKLETNGEEKAGGSEEKESKEEDSKEVSKEEDSKEVSKEEDSKKESNKEDSKEVSKEEDSKKESKDKTEAKKSDEEGSDEKDSKKKIDKQKDRTKNNEEGSGKSDSDKKDSDDKNEVKEETKVSEPAKSSAGSSAAASPSVRRLARELGVDINFVSGNGERVSENDIKEYVRTHLNTGGSQNSPGIQKAIPDFKKWGQIEIEPMSKIRTITAEAMTYAWTTIPMVTQFDRTDITALEEFRKKYSKKYSEDGAHLTITSILVKICEAALKAFPQFNSSIDLQKREVIYKKYFNIGVAVDTDRGLLVPVIKNTDGKNIRDISIELGELADKARNKKITPEEMDGGNFTISNLGGIGGTNFSPIVYSPQVAILGVSRGSTEAVLVNDKFEPRLILPLALTYDHRIIDGADAARFLRWICEALENPISILL